jgi:serine/threonine protein phosphatase PrpC
VFTGAQQKVAFGGTPAFMAPELFLSNTKIDFTKSPGIDVFALGATLYYMLMGRPPWMAKNQIDLAKQIRDIELSFPVPVDPSVRHLLKQMLKKDYRTRCKLDDIVVDEWVTLEGSDPLFERDETFVDNFTDFASFCAVDDINAFNPSLKILIVHESLVIRTMFHNQINTQHAAICAEANNCERALNIVNLVMKQHPINFDFIFIDILPANKNGDILKEQGLHAVRSLRDMGYKGKIIGMNATHEDVEAEFVQAGCNTVVKRPIANCELLNLLNREVPPEHANFVSAEEVAQAITLSGTAPLPMSQSPLTIGSRKSSMNDGSQFDSDSIMVDDSLLASDSVDREDMADFMVDFDACRRDIPPPVAKPATGRKSLSRKGGFMMLKGTNDNFVDFDSTAAQPVKFFSFKDGNSKDAMRQRQERREQAMKRSQAAQEYRQAKKSGDEGRSKSMLNILKQQSKKSLYERKRSLRTTSNESNRSMMALKSVAGNALRDNVFDSPSSSYRGSVSNASPPTIITSGSDYAADTGTSNRAQMARLEDVFIEEIHNDDDNFDSDHDENELDEEDNSDVDVDGSIGESSNDEDDDLGNLGDGDIFQLDDQAMSDLFDTLTLKKDGKEHDVQEWNHTVFGVSLANTLSAKPENTNADLHIKFGFAEVQGTRSYMEDRIYAKALEPSRIGEGLSPLAIFGVFDGHGGDFVAQYLQTRYASIFASAYRALEVHLDFSSIDPESGIYEAAVARAFEETNARLDRALLEKDYARQQKNMAAGAGIGQETNFSGAVGIVAVVAPAKQLFDGKPAVQVFLSHVGDCRGVLSQDGVAKVLTEDHKATNKSEKIRIEMAGGFVQNGRVNGALMVTRSFGDIQHKNFAPCVGHKGNENEPGGIWAENQHVISKPDFTHLFVFNDSFEFIILASDGIWDVFECQEAVNFVRKRLLTTKDLTKTADELMQKGLQRGTQDNTSCIIIAFNQ